MLAIDKLIERVIELRSPVCVGLDPTPKLIPEGLTFLSFNKALIDAVYDIVPCVKLQSAMYECFGPEGVATYIETIKYAKSKGLIVIGDVKRNDIASSAAAYADAYLSPEGADFITVNPYLGGDSIEPFLTNAKHYDKGLFILVKTSYPGGADIQDLELKNGERLYEHVGNLVSKWGAGLTGKYGFSSVGAVVGATWPEQASSLRRRLPNTYFLVPGYGAQGGSQAGVAVCFNKSGLGGVVNSSRGIIAAWKSEEYVEKYGRDGSAMRFADCAREETLKMRDNLRGHIYDK